MGGSPDLPSDLQKIEKAAAYLSANEHGAMLRDADYIVCVDQEHQRLREPMQSVLAPFGVPIISRQEWADYRITREFKIPSLNSGFTAICVAHLLGAWPIIVAGIGLYQAGTYFHDTEAASSGNDRSDDEWRNRIAKLKRFVRTDCVRVVSGPLVEHFAQYDPAEEFPQYETPPLLKRLVADSAVKIEIICERTYAEGARLIKGDVIRVSESTAKRLINTGRARLHDEQS